MRITAKRATLIVLISGPTVLAVLLGVLWVGRSGRLELPRPTGPFAVGRVSELWVDSLRVDPFASPAKRELLVWTWYPTDPSTSGRSAAYFPEDWRRAYAESRGFLLTNFLWRDERNVAGHSLDGPDLAPDSAAYPVVIFRSGIGAPALSYATVAEDLASHGYVVVGADTPRSTVIVPMPDGRIIYRTTAANPGDAQMPEQERQRLLAVLMGVWSADTGFLMDRLELLNAGVPGGRFAGRLDLARVGVVGHSFGGATAAQFCHDDPRCRAGVDLDGALHGSVVDDGLRQPFLFLLSDHGAQWTSADCEICRDIRSAAGRLPDNKTIATVLGADHFSFSDQSLTMNGLLRKALGALGGPGRLPAERGLGLTTRVVADFFGAFLRPTPGSRFTTSGVEGLRSEEMAPPYG